jgi:hypothetical protein
MLTYAYKIRVKKLDWVIHKYWYQAPDEVRLSTMLEV